MSICAGVCRQHRNASERPGKWHYSMHKHHRIGSNATVDISTSVHLIQQHCLYLATSFLLNLARLQNIPKIIPAANSERHSFLDSRIQLRCVDRVDRSSSCCSRLFDWIFVPNCLDYVGGYGIWRLHCFRMNGSSPGLKSERVQVGELLFASSSP